MLVAISSLFKVESRLFFFFFLKKDDFGDSTFESSPNNMTKGTNEVYAKKKYKLSNSF